MVTNKHRNILRKLYETVHKPNSFGGVKSLLRNAKKIDKDITEKVVREFLESQISYTLHKNTKKKFVRRKIVSPKPKVIASCDLADVTNLHQHNNGIKYMLFVIDVFSRFLKVVPLKNKSAEAVLRGIKEVFESNDFKGVSRLNSDEGREFYNKSVDGYLKKKGIRLYSVHSREIKASIAERVIRTIKNKIYRYLTHNHTLKYINVLDAIVVSYNNSPHTALGYNKTPKQIHNLNDKVKIKQQFDQMYKRESEAKYKFRPVLDVGTTVRISDEGRNAIFRKGYTVQNTIEIFKIRKVDKSKLPIAYFLQDLRNENIEGIFYREELTPTATPKFYDIEIIKKKKVKGKVKYLVKWKGYPQEFNSWINASEIIKT